MKAQIINPDNQKILFSNSYEAKSFWQRLIGLMFKKGMGIEDALIFYNAPSIHTFFMRFPIDIIFLDKNTKVLKILKICQPNKIFFFRGASCTIECQGGATDIKQIYEGQTLKIKY